MKKIIVLAFLAAAFCFAASAQESEKEAARRPLENYLKGHATGSADAFAAAFYPEARLLFARDGKFAQRTSAEYVKGAGSGKAADDENKRRRAIEFLEVTGSAAVAKVTLDYPNVYFVDYFALLKIGGEWKIVNKSFHIGARKDQTEMPALAVSEAERRAIAGPLENYLKAQATGSADLIRAAFHPEAKVMEYWDGKFAQYSVDEFAGRFKGAPAADEAQRKRRFEIIDATPTAAIARVTLDYPAVRFTDYITLIKVDGEWKIINKTFNAERKEAKK